VASTMVWSRCWCSLTSELVHDGAHHAGSLRRSADGAGAGGGGAVRMVQKKLGWKEVGDDDDWQVYWTDTSVALERIMRLKATQKINHFTGKLGFLCMRIPPSCAFTTYTLHTDNSPRVAKDAQPLSQSDILASTVVRRGRISLRCYTPVCTLHRHAGDLPQEGAGAQHRQDGVAVC
jgi:hypothetical protein